MPEKIQYEGENPNDFSGLESVEIAPGLSVGRLLRSKTFVQSSREEKDAIYRELKDKFREANEANVAHERVLNPAPVEYFERDIPAAIGQIGEDIAGAAKMGKDVLGALSSPSTYKRRLQAAPEIFNQLKQSLPDIATEAIEAPGNAIYGPFLGMSPEEHGKRTTAPLLETLGTLGAGRVFGKLANKGYLSGGLAKKDIARDLIADTVGIATKKDVGLYGKPGKLTAAPERGAFARVLFGKGRASTEEARKGLMDDAMWRIKDFTDRNNLRVVDSLNDETVPIAAYAAKATKKEFWDTQVAPRASVLNGTVLPQQLTGSISQEMLRGIDPQANPDLFRQVAARNKEIYFDVTPNGTPIPKTWTFDQAMNRLSALDKELLTVYANVDKAADPRIAGLQKMVTQREADALRNVVLGWAEANGAPDIKEARRIYGALEEMDQAFGNFADQYEREATWRRAHPVASMAAEVRPEEAGGSSPHRRVYLGRLSERLGEKFLGGPEASIRRAWEIGFKKPPTNIGTGPFVPPPPPPATGQVVNPGGGPIPPTGGGPPFAGRGVGYPGGPALPAGPAPSAPQGALPGPSQKASPPAPPIPTPSKSGFRMRIKPTAEDVDAAGMGGFDRQVNELISDERIEQLRRKLQGRGEIFDPEFELNEDDLRILRLYGVNPDSLK